MKESFLNGTEIPVVEQEDVAFGVKNLDNFPPYNEIPKCFGMNGKTKWDKLLSDWFFIGLKSLDITPKKGVDLDSAKRYIRANMITRVSKHEHKAAGIAYIMSLWFEDAKWEVNEKEK